VYLYIPNLIGKPLDDWFFTYLYVTLLLIIIHNQCSNAFLEEYPLLYADYISPQVHI
jgi:hypothetical protein